MVHTWALKKEVQSIYNNDLKSILLTWSDCKNYILKNYRKGCSVRVVNWKAHLLFDLINKKTQTVFDFYMNKIIANKNLRNFQKTS